VEGGLNELFERNFVKIKILLCNCKGLCPSFQNADMNTLPFMVESELDVQYTIVHPQLCGQGGNEVVTDIMRRSAADPDTYIIGGACAPEAQFKLFKKVMRNRKSARAFLIEAGILDRTGTSLARPYRPLKWNAPSPKSKTRMNGGG